MTRDEALDFMKKSRASDLRSLVLSHRESLGVSQFEYAKRVREAVRVCKETSPYHHGKEESS